MQALFLGSDLLPFVLFPFYRLSLFLKYFVCILILDDILELVTWDSQIMDNWFDLYQFFLVVSLILFYLQLVKVMLVV